MPTFGALPPSREHKTSDNTNKEKIEEFRSEKNQPKGSRRTLARSRRLLASVTARSRLAVRLASLLCQS